MNTFYEENANFTSFCANCTEQLRTQRQPFYQLMCVQLQKQNHHDVSKPQLVVEMDPN